MRSLAFLLFACLQVASAVDPLTVWHARMPLFPDLTLQAVVSANGTTVAVGSDGRAIVSTDLVHWSEVNTPTFSSLNAVTFADGRFVAVGDFGTAIFSSDGFNWQEAETDTLNDLNGITYANGLWVAVGENAEVMLSTNGATFTTAITGSTPLNAVTYAFGKFIAAGGNGAVLTSVNGRNWSRSSIPTEGRIAGMIAADGKLIVYGQGSAYVAGAGIWTTTNLTDWQGSAYYLSANAGAYANGRFVLMMSWFVNSSTNGFDWQPQWHDSGPIELRAMAAANGSFIGVGSDGAVFLSSTGENWTNQTVLHTAPIQYVVHGSPGYLAAGWNEILFSAEGVSWQTVYSSNELFYAVQYGDGIWVVSGQDEVASTRDFQVWHHTPNVSLTSIAYGAGRFVAIAANQVLTTSTDGENWFGLNVGFAEKLREVIYAGGLFVGVGDDGVILHSVNGLNWSKADSADGSTDAITEVTFGNGIFLAAIGSGQ